MPQAKTVTTVKNFSKGLAMDTSPLNFPDNFVKDMQNMVLNLDGSVQKRLGNVEELGGTSVGTTSSTSASNIPWRMFIWESINGDPNKKYIVVSDGTIVIFQDLNSNSPSTDIANSFALPATNLPVQFVVSGKFLIIIIESSTSYVTPIVVKYDSATNTFSKSTTTLQLKVRDLWGVNDTLAVDTRWAGLINEHNYNLFNQGWNLTDINAFVAANGVYPSNADIHNIGYWDNGTTGAKTWAQARVFNTLSFGTTPSPKGKFILNLETRGADRDSAAGFTAGTLKADTETVGPSVAASHFGRVFYSGFGKSTATASTLEDTSPNLANMILYTEVIKNEASLGKCYQEADPTSSEDSALVDTDGGYISIPGLGRVKKMIPFRNSLIVFASGGIWSITTTGAFTPTNYEIHKVSELVIDSPQSVVQAENDLLFFADRAIHVMQLDSSLGVDTSAKTKNISAGRIDSILDNLHPSYLAEVTGIYQKLEKKIIWLYNRNVTLSATDAALKNSELVYDIRLDAFYRHYFKDYSNEGFTHVFERGIYTPAPSLTRLRYFRVFGDTVTTGTYKYMYTYNGDDGFQDTSYGDTAELTDISAYILTGDYTFGDIARNKRIPYLTMHFNRTETSIGASGPTLASSCTVTPRWEWTDTTDSHRWGSSFEAYRYTRPYAGDVGGGGTTFETGHEIITTKNKIRGHGKAIRYYFNSSNGKDMQVLGYSMSATGGTAT